MSARLTVIFYIVLCLEAGLVLTFLPWLSPFGLSDWGNNFFLVYVAQKAGLPSLQSAVASGWVRGAVTGLGLVNLALAGWESLNFRRTVRLLGGGAGGDDTAASSARHAANADLPDHLSHHGRGD